MTHMTASPYFAKSPNPTKQIDNIQEDFIRLSGYASQLYDIESSKLCNPRAGRKLKDVQRYLLYLENQFIELRSLLEVNDVLYEASDEPFDLNQNFASHSSGGLKGSTDQKLAAEFKDSILNILIDMSKNQDHLDLVNTMIALRRELDRSMKKVAVNLNTCVN